MQYLGHEEYIFAIKNTPSGETLADSCKVLLQKVPQTMATANLGAPICAMPPLGGRRRSRPGTAALAAMALLLAEADVVPADTHSAPATAPAEAGTWTPERTAFGHAMPSRDATLSASFAATVTQVAVEPGQQVQGGQVLARLEAPALAAIVGKLQAARRAAD